jgi:hypothetical protein
MTFRLVNPPITSDGDRWRSPQCANAVRCDHIADKVCGMPWIEATSMSGNSARTPFGELPSAYNRCKSRV